jgi:hypothetical protein
MVTALEYGLTPQRTLTIGMAGNAGTMDVTENLGKTTVKFEEELNKLDRLTFSLVHGGEVYAELLDIGDPVTFEGGYRWDQAGSGTPTRVFFKGFVTEPSIKCAGGGRVIVDVTAQDVRWLLTRNKPGSLTYPAPKYDHEIYPREFRKGVKGPGGVTGLKISDIVKGILEEYAPTLKIGKMKILEDDDYLFTFDNPIVQNADETDFQFVLRLLTGEGQSRFTGVHRDERRVVNANAVWWMEPNPLTGEAEVHIVNEEEALKEQGLVEFIWQGEGFEKVPEADYDPTAMGARIICKELTFKQNLDLARNREVRVQKDVQKKAKGKKGKTQATQATEPNGVRGEESERSDEDQSPAAIQSFLDTHEIDEAKVRASGAANAATAGLEIFRKVSSGQARLSQYRHFFKPKEVRQEATSRAITSKPGDADRPEKPEAPATDTPLPPGAPKAKKKTKKPKKLKPLGERIQKFGFTVSASGVHGNIFMQARRMYKVKAPVPRYAPDGHVWFCHKVIHEFGQLYTMSWEMGR